MARTCASCGTPIQACMGFTCSGDFLNFGEAFERGDEILPTVREWCGLCVLRWPDPESIPGYTPVSTQPLSRRT